MNLQRTADLLAKKAKTCWCSYCHAMEARHFLKRRDGKGTIALCQECYDWHMRGKM